MGRPKAKIDLKIVEGMASVGATNCEIADFLGLNEGTVRKNCGPTLEKARASLKVRLRRKQIQVALDDGNVTMLIWLGKQMLDQKDKTDVTSDDKVWPASLTVKYVRAPVRDDD